MTKPMKMSVGRGLVVAIWVGAAGCGTTGKRADGGANDAAAEAVTDGNSDAAADGSGDASDDAAAATDGATDLADSDAFPGPVIAVSTFGCFARSGDGTEYFADGTPATIVTNSPWRTPCGLAWVGLDVNGYTKPTTPTTEDIVRKFTVDGLLSDRATITLSFEVDDAAELVLNGKAIGACTPPDSNAGECQSSCHVVTLAKDALLPPGQVNVLEIKMVNLFNTSAPGGNTGYTGISYAVCAEGE